MNKSILLGRLVKDPDIRYTQTHSGELAIANFRIAVSRKYAKENGPNADFFTCTAFGKKAEFVSNYFAKGAKIAVEGRMENDNYENNQGEKVYSVRLMVDDVDFADSKGEESGEDREDRSSGRRAETGTRRSSSETNGRRNTAASKSRESEQRGRSTSRTAARATASASRTSSPQRRSTASRDSYNVDEEYMNVDEEPMDFD